LAVLRPVSTACFRHADISAENVAEAVYALIVPANSLPWGPMAVVESSPFA
jgi:hypothetical protein